MNCRKVSHLLSAYMDGELPGVEHRLIHEHLQRCRECHAEYEGLLQTKRLLARLRVQSPRPELPSVILDRIGHERNRLESHVGFWQTILQRLREITPAPHHIALGGALAIVGVLFVVNHSDASDEIEWYPAGQAPAASPLPAATLSQRELMMPGRPVVRVSNPFAVPTSDRGLRRSPWQSSAFPSLPSGYTTSRMPGASLTELFR